MAQDKIMGRLSDGSEYVYHSSGSQLIYKDVTVRDVLFTVCRLHEKVLENPKTKHIYTVTAGADGHEYCTVTLDPNLDNVEGAFQSYWDPITGTREIRPEEVIANCPHDTLLREEEPQITFGMFVEAVQTANIFDFNHPEILKILGETLAEA